MQRFVYIQAYDGGDNGLGKINALLEEGWKVVGVNVVMAGECNLEALILIEKD